MSENYLCHGISFNLVMPYLVLLDSKTVDSFLMHLKIADS